jgi:hypothetical protein
MRCRGGRPARSAPAAIAVAAAASIFAPTARAIGTPPSSRDYRCAGSDGSFHKWLDLSDRLDRRHHGDPCHPSGYADVAEPHRRTGLNGLAATTPRNAGSRVAPCRGRAGDVPCVQGVADGGQHLKAVLGISAGAAVDLPEVPHHLDREPRGKPVRWVDEVSAVASKRLATGRPVRQISPIRPGADKVSLRSDRDFRRCFE